VPQVSNPSLQIFCFTIFLPSNFSALSASRHELGEQPKWAKKLVGKKIVGKEI
jgi:hypothetical protein